MGYYYDTIWFISPGSYTQDYVSYYSLTRHYYAQLGRVNQDVYADDVRPVLNLKSGVKFKEGTDGTIENPYELTL